MKRYLAPLIDAVFILAYLIFVPAALDALHNVARIAPKLYFYVSLYAAIFYPLACLAMLQKMAANRPLQDGIVTLHRGMWRWYSWPAGIIFWIMLLFHSAMMAMSPLLGDIIRGSEGPSLISTASDKLWFGTAVAVFFITISLILAKMTGFTFKRLYEWLKECSLIALILSAPLWLFFMASLVLITPFYFYCIVWYYAINRANSGREFASFLPDTRPVRFLSNAVLLIYTVILAFFFEEWIAYVGSFNNDLGPILNTCLAMTLLYVPYRIFFGLYSGKSWLGWTTFALSVIIVFMQTLSQLGGVP